MKSAVQAEKVTAKKAYEAPRLVTHGGVEKLTLHQGNGCFSGVGDKWDYKHPHH